MKSEEFLFVLTFTPNLTPPLTLVALTLEIAYLLGHEFNRKSMS